MSVRRDQSADAWIGFDVGGQSVKAALVDSRAQVIAENRSPTGQTFGVDELVGALAKLSTELGERAGVERRVDACVGVGIAGVMASDGVLAGSPNLPGLVGARVRDVLAERLGRPVAIDNDANCAALAEVWVGGAAERKPNVLVVTLGSGVGSGLILDGELYHGTTGYACELGHTIVCAGGRTCGCGNAGCLEAYVSESAARARVAELGPALAARVKTALDAGAAGYAHALFRLAEDGDRDARAVVEEMVAMLGVGLASAVNLLDVTVIVLGGGIAPAVLAHRSALERAIDDSLFARSVDRIDVLAARRGPEAGAVGAARLAMLASRSV